MSTKEVTAISIKILAIWLLVHVVLEFSTVAHLAVSVQRDLGYGDHSSVLVIGLFITTAIVGGTACFLLFRLSNSVLCSLNDRSESDAGKLSQEFILQISGLFFVVSALIELPRAINETYLTTQTLVGGNGMSLVLPYLMYLLAVLFKFVVGVTMVIGSKRCNAWLLKLRGRA